ncbi:MAG: hypothetical protein GY765_01525 [bacterium]|nr:hypothetical protein [bacterium]
MGLLENYLETHDKTYFEIYTGIKTDDFHLSLDTEYPIHAPLALICKGHGSDYFDEVVNYFADNSLDIDGKGTTIRGELLTALLLMADELDLHSSRAVFKKNYPLSKTSELHHYRHYYISKVEVLSGTADLKKGFKEKEGGVLCLYGCQSSGIHLFTDFIECILLAESADAHMTALNFGTTHNYHTIEDILDAIAHHVRGADDPPDAVHSFTDLFCGGKYHMVVLQSLHCLGEPLLQEVYDKIIQKCRKSHKNLLIPVAAGDDMPLLNGLTFHTLPGQFTHDDIYDYVHRHGSRPQKSGRQNRQMPQAVGNQYGGHGRQIYADRRNSNVMSRPATNAGLRPLHRGSKGRRPLARREARRRQPPLVV